MTLEEAVVHAREKGMGEGPCAAEHRQLAAWLQELGARRLDECAPPPATEGSREAWRKVHNLVVHPLMEVLPRPWGEWLHEVTGRLAFEGES